MERVHVEITPLRVADAFRITLDPKRDARGYFVRVYDEAAFAEAGLTTAWVQENQSLSGRKGLIRGLHFQRPPHAETKLIRAVAGAVLDVLVDLRTDSPTYGRWEAVELTADNFTLAYVPKGFAHGFCTLSDRAVVQYKVDARYAPEAEGGIRWDDPDLSIDWPVDEPFLSERDRGLPLLGDFDSPFRRAAKTGPTGS